MNRNLVLILLLLCASLSVNAQANLSQQDSLRAIDSYLKQLYAYSNETFDTSSINFRKECSLMLKSDDPKMVVNGSITLGLLNLYSDHDDAAIHDFKTALAKDSSCYLCYNKLHWLYWYKKNNYGEANRYLKMSTAKFEALILQDSSDVELWSKLYHLYGLKEGGNTLKTKQRMNYISNKIVTLAPDNAYYWWENSFHHENDKKAEEDALIKAYTLRPQESIFWNALANYYYEQKQLNKVLKILNAVKEDPDTNPEYWYQQMAYYLYHFNKKEEAKKVYFEAKEKGYTIVYKF